MNREEVIEMGREAGFTPDYAYRAAKGDVEEIYKAWPEEIERFATLVAAKEREECAKVADKFAESSQYKTQRNLAEWCASSIRARGQQ